MPGSIGAVPNLNGVNLGQLQSALKPRLTKYIPWDPTPKQTAFLLMTSIKEILYGGAAGGGKSVVQLMGALQYVDIPGYSALLIRKTYADLIKPDALMDMAKKWLMPFVQTGEVKWSEKTKCFTFPSGATLTFGYLEHENDKYQYQGAQYQYIGVDECTQIVPAGYKYLFSRLRKPVWLKVPLRFRATANPGGEFGDFYYNRFFLNKGKRVFIGAKIADNPHLHEAEYRESLAELDAVERAQLEEGNWEIREPGDMFDRGWFPIVPATAVHPQAKIVRFWDLASTDPKKRRNKKDKRDPDWTVGFKLAFYKHTYWILDIIRVQKKPGDVETLIKLIVEGDGYRCLSRMEQEPGSSGQIVTDHYADNVLIGYDFDGVTSSGSKVERARTASSAAKRGNVFIVEGCRNIDAFLDEAELFPYATHDDTIDGFSGAFNTFRQVRPTVAPQGIATKKSSSYWRES